jgi:hypothetical protein
MEANEYEVENTVSLNSDFMKLLTDKQGARSKPQNSPHSVGPELEQMLDTLEMKNVYDNSEALQHFDPFEKVLLVKGMDNSLLTSCRTLKGENNTLSETFKIVHK